MNLCPPMDFMKEVYLTLIEQGWTLNDIDEMDFFYYMDLLIFKSRKSKKRFRSYIDQVL